MFGFSPSMYFPYRRVLKEFNPNVFWHESFGDHWYDISNSKDIVITNPYIRVAQRLLACGLFAREDILTMSRLSKLYFFNSMPQGHQHDPGSSLVNQLYSAATSSIYRIVIRGLITHIAVSVGIELDPDNRIPGSGLLNLASFEQLKFYKVEGGRICWIYLGNSPCLT